MASSNQNTITITNSSQKQLDLNNKNDINILMNIETNEELEDVIVHSMIEQFMNLSEEDNKIFNYIKQEFKDMKILTYGSLLFIQTDQNIENFPHISELLPSWVLNKSITLVYFCNWQWEQEPLFNFVRIRIQIPHYTTTILEYKFLIF